MPRRSGARILAAVLFTDIVDSSAVASRIGDARWKELIARHHAIVRRELKRYGGRELDTAGDGFFASFGEPAAAIRCACAVAESVRDLGIEIRAGVHFGECEQLGSKLGGIAVVVGARVMSLGGAGDVLVTSTTSELVAGAGFGFQDRGAHSLKGVDGQWHVLAVTEVDGVPRAQPAEQEAAEHRLTEVQPSALLSRRWLTSRPWAVGIAVLLVLALVAIAIPALRSGGGVVNVGTNSIARLNGEDGSLDFTTALGERPAASVIGFGSLWVTEPDRGVVARLNLDDGSVVDRIEVGTSPAGVAVGEGSVWVANAGDGTVSRIDPESGTVGRVIPVGSGPTGIAVGNGALWVTDAIGAEFFRVDVASERATPVTVAGQPSGVTLTSDGVWVSYAPSGIARVDPAPAQASVTVTGNVGSGPTAVLRAFDSIWVANHVDGTVSRLEPSSGILKATIPVGDGPSALVAAAGSVWVANEFGGSITEIDPATDTAAQTVPVGGAAVSLAADGDSLWLAVGASATEHRGGTLNVSSPTRVPASLDPAVAYTTTAWQILSITNDGLLSYKKVGGPDGTTLVPDLASALPQVSTDGLTYRFPLRRGIRYSTGELVRPEDFRYGLQRAISLNPDARSLLGALEGAEACSKDPHTCDLSDAVEVDDEAVTFHLLHPDPDLPLKLALPWGDPVPASVAAENMGLDPVPATGPYMVVEAGANHVQLIRNRAFREWSGAAQPAGFVDSISWRFEEELGSAFKRLQADEVDFMTDRPQPDDLASLEAARPGQVVLQPLNSTRYVGTDIHRPPFDDVRVRQALNYAIDRDRVVELFGGPSSVRPTCQILPPNFQGYEPYCPYTLEPRSGAWSAPDPDRAHALIDAAHAKGKKVTVWVTDDPLGTLGTRSQRVGTMRYVVKVLNGLGLRAHLKLVHEVEEYSTAVRAGEAQVYLFGWLSDYPRAGDFLAAPFRCGSDSNASGLCDDNIETAIDEAYRLQPGQPAASNATWTSIEHQLVDDAIWVPVMNPVAAYALSARTENVQVSPVWGVLLSRLWVQ